MIQLVIPAPQRTIFAEQALDLGGNGYGSLFDIKLHLETRGVAFKGSRCLLHLLVNQQKMTALFRRKQRGAKPKSVDFTLNFDLATQPPHASGIERYVNYDPVQAGAQTLEPPLETLNLDTLTFGARNRLTGLDFGGFRHGRHSIAGILI